MRECVYNLLTMFIKKYCCFNIMNHCNISCNKCKFTHSYIDYKLSTILNEIIDKYV